MVQITDDRPTDEELTAAERRGEERMQTDPRAQAVWVRFVMTPILNASERVLEPHRSEPLMDSDPFVRIRRPRKYYRECATLLDVTRCSKRRATASAPGSVWPSSCAALT